MTSAKSLSSTVKLNDGVSMPLFGLGTYLLKPGVGGEAELAVKHALKVGYRMIDTAEFYGNEADVGRAIRESGVKREDIFLVSKIWDHGYDQCRKTVQNALNKMELGYIDLYLIHTPLGGQNCDTYRAMMEFKEQGLIKSCGVSNFGVHHLEGLKEAGLPTPSVNQLELHPWQQKADIASYCQNNEITLMGYSPLTKGQRLQEPSLVDIAKKYNKSPAALLLRWSVQRGIVTIPKSGNLDRITENAQVFDWSISVDDMNKLNSFPQWSCTWNPTTSPWQG
ncbi:uncharacterized oxidoreductase YtbE-like [Liolophura sinensis]|uniref:uncharacterized oxidoreductase YtbE-like n=1 Tax=Liolophura sinensis TaxID=3198878 RepID=UPI0031584423